MPFITDKLESMKKDSAQEIDNNKNSHIAFKTDDNLNADSTMLSADSNSESDSDSESKKSTESQYFVSRFSFSVDSVIQALKSHIIGQDEALQGLEKLLYIIKAELSPSYKPLGVVLLLGGTGVGKTSTAILLAKLLGGNFCRIDMNTLTQEHYAASIVGAPPGYVGSKEGNTLFDENAIAGSYSCPSVVLFDEIEKASKEVLTSLLDVLDSGELTLTSGTKKIDFKNAIIIMTSNLGAKEMLAYHKRVKNSNPKKERKILTRVLERTFLPEFLNRIDTILHYSSITKEHILRIIDLEIAEIYNKNGHKIILDEDVQTHLCKAYNIKYGVRDIKRLFKNEILPLVAKEILANKQKSIIRLDNKHKFAVE